MPSVRAVESRIRNVEGFAVAVYWHHGGDVRSDMQRPLPPYRYRQAASGSITVAEWKRTRFRPNYPGFDVEVLDRRGHSVSGNLRLATLRERYAG